MRLDQTLLYKDETISSGWNSTMSCAQVCTWEIEDKPLKMLRGYFLVWLIHKDHFSNFYSKVFR